MNPYFSPFNVSKVPFVFGEFKGLFCSRCKWKGLILLMSCRRKRLLYYQTNSRNLTANKKTLQIHGYHCLDYTLRNAFHWFEQCRGNLIMWMHQCPGHKGVSKNLSLVNSDFCNLVIFRHRSWLSTLEFFCRQRIFECLHRGNQISYCCKVQQSLSPHIWKLYQKYCRSNGA